MLFAAEFREIQTTDTDVVAWDTFEIPRGSRASTKGGRTIFSASYDAPRRVPAAGRVIVSYMGEPALDIVYGVTTPVIPTLRSKAMDAAGQPAAGCYRAYMPVGSEFNLEFAGYDAMPDEKWLQLNNSDDRFTVQVKLKKMLPEDIFRDTDSGAFYVYGVERFVVHVRAPRTDDRGKALAI